MLPWLFIIFLERSFVMKSISSVVRQKGKSQNWCFKKTKHVKFSKKLTFLTPWYAHARCVCRNPSYIHVNFSENLAYFVFLKHPFWVSPFCLITDDLTASSIFCLAWGILILVILKNFKPIIAIDKRLLR